MARSRSSSRSSRGSLSDNDSLSLHSTDSQSSIAPSIQEPASQETCDLSPVHRLPAELIISVFAKLSSPADVRNCMLVSKDWARNAVGLLWHRPQTHKWPSIQIVAQSLRKADSYFAYDTLVKRLNMSALGNEISDGTLQPFSGCKRIERLTLTNCNKLTDLSMVPMLQGNRSLLALDVTSLDSITDLTMTAVANNCYKLQGLNISNCKKISDNALESVARSCKNLKRLKFNGCSQLTEKSVIMVANSCRYILEIDLHDCRNIEDAAITSLIAEGRYLRELRLAHCSRITDHAFLNLPHGIIHDALRILDLTDCGELNDDGVQKIIATAPRLRNLVLAKCRKITDRAVYAITKLGKNLHYIHLGHCARITDAGVLQLVKQCSRIRYIDLACCNNLSDNSIKQLATLPKLKRIGLVKCGQITDQSIVALAKPKQVGPNGQVAPSSLERVHLSYCTLLTLNGIHALLNNCPRLTHLSLTGVISFLREDLLVFCREAPPEFNEHQRDVFCVFSGSGVSRLRDHLNEEQLGQHYETDGTMYDDGDDGHGGNGDIVVNVGPNQHHVTAMMGAAALSADMDADEDLGEDSEITG